MFEHRKKLEQFGGVNGELAAAMQYFVQGIGCRDPKLRDMFMDIATDLKLPRGALFA